MEDAIDRRGKARAPGEANLLIPHHAGPVVKRLNPLSSSYERDWESETWCRVRFQLTVVLRADSPTIPKARFYAVLEATGEAIRYVPSRQRPSITHLVIKSACSPSSCSPFRLCRWRAGKFSFMVDHLWSGSSRRILKLTAGCCNRTRRKAVMTVVKDGGACLSVHGNCSARDHGCGIDSRVFCEVDVENAIDATSPSARGRTAGSEPCILRHRIHMVNGPSRSGRGPRHSVPTSLPSAPLPFVAQSISCLVIQATLHSRRLQYRPVISPQSVRHCVERRIPTQESEVRDLPPPWSDKPDPVHSTDSPPATLSQRTRCAPSARFRRRYWRSSPSPLPTFPRGQTKNSRSSTSTTSPVHGPARTATESLSTIVAPCNRQAQNSTSRIKEVHHLCSSSEQDGSFKDGTRDCWTCVLGRRGR